MAQHHDIYIIIIIIITVGEDDDEGVIHPLIQLQVSWIAQEVLARNLFLVYLLTLSIDEIIQHEMIKISEYGIGELFKWLRPNLRYYFGIFLE
jgi:hypothetical protein